MRAVRKIIEVSGLEKKYKQADESALRKISFYVNEGSFFSLLGPNGAGKTTTISILTTTLSPTNGKVEIDGFDVARQANKVRAKIGVIFQNPSLDINLSAEENIRFHVNLYNLFPYRPVFNWMDTEYKNKVLELAELLGIQKQLHKPVKTFSGGMKRKLEIVRSLMHKPKVLFLDEPTTGLDPISRKSLWSYLKKIKDQEKMTIFLTTHYLEEAENSDYVCVINKGEVVSKGTPGEIKEALVREYVVVDAYKRKALESELKKNSWQYEGNGPFKIQLDKTVRASSVVQQIQTPLSNLDVHKPTLEEAYLAIIENN